MKKIAIAGIIASLILLEGCGNKQLLDTKFTFTKAIVKIGADYKNVDLKSWKDYDNDTQVQITTTDGHTYLVEKSNITFIDK